VTNAKLSRISWAGLVRWRRTVA